MTKTLYRSALPENFGFRGFFVGKLRFSGKKRLEQEAAPRRNPCLPLDLQFYDALIKPFAGFMFLYP